MKSQSYGQSANLHTTFLSFVALSINPARTVKLLNETQNVCALDLSDRKILIKFIE
jgi:hypothetical protein